MKCKFSISVGEKTGKKIRQASEELELNISSFITMLVNNWEKEQKAMQVMDNMEEFKRMIEGAQYEKGKDKAEKGKDKAEN